MAAAVAVALRSYAYEIPAEPFSAAWPRHTLATGFKPITPWLPGQGGPGTAKAFKPDLRLDVDKPSILLSGDDNGTVTVLTPLFDSASGAGLGQMRARARDDHTLQQYYTLHLL